MSALGSNELAHEVQVDQPLAQVFSGSIARVSSSVKQLSVRASKWSVHLRDLDYRWLPAENSAR